MEVKTKKIDLGGVACFRTSVFSREWKEEKYEIGAERIKTGYGLTEKSSIEDFINRNKFEILEAIYEEKITTKIDVPAESSES